MALKRTEELVQDRFAISVVMIETIVFWKMMNEVNHNTGTCNL